MSFEPTLNGMLERNDVDVVVVATPHSLHRQHVVQVAGAGKHVLVEKPMALSTAECDAMIAACQRAGVTLGVIQTARYTAPARAAHELIEAGRIGDVHMLQSSWLEPGYSPADPGSENQWVSDPAEGGAFLDAGVHAFDLLRWFAGSEVTHVFGSALTYSHTSLVYLSGMAELTFASGAIASTWISFELPPPGFRKHTLRTRVVGSRGVLDVDSYGPLLLGDADGVRVVLERAPYDMTDLTHPARLEQFIAQMQEYVDAMRAGREPPVGGADGRAAVQIVEACYHASATRETVRLR